MSPKFLEDVVLGVEVLAQCDSRVIPVLKVTPMRFLRSNFNIIPSINLRKSGDYSLFAAVASKC